MYAAKLKFGCAALALLVFSGTSNIANAADAAANSWNGFYVGVTTGYGSVSVRKELESRESVVMSLIAPIREVLHVDRREPFPL